jgi:acyl-CoA synthetase (AMP-forming)/AMP-acid ligase II
VAARHLSGLDFSNVKAFVVGAELIDPDVLVRFERLLAPAGLQPGRVLPAYGLAEATLAVSGAPLGQRWTSRAPSSGGRPFVSCGRPLAGVSIAVVDESGRALADGTVGEIVCRGESVAAGYAGAADEAANAAFSGGTLQTGDAGFLADGDLFPIGRMGDSLKVRGTALFAEHLESALHAAGYAREHNVVLLGLRDGRPAIVWISASASGVDHEMIAALQRLGEGAPVWCVLAARGAILRTSSGKPRRRVLWSDFIRGRLSAKVAEPSGGEAQDPDDD